MSKQLSTTALVINTRSRKAERFFFRVIDTLNARGLEVNLYPVRQPDQLAKTVELAIKNGNTTIILGGGDGTISALIKYFVHTDLVLGILPLGTANSFVKSLGISENLEEAIETIIHGKSISIDVGCCNALYFANAASFGFTTRIAKNLSPRLKKFFGKAAYLVEGLRQALSMQRFELTVTNGTKQESFSTHQVIIANGSFYGPTPLAASATLNSHKLVLLAMKDMSRFKLLWAWLKTLFGKDLGYNSGHQLIADSFTLSAKPVQAISIDGELHRENPMKFSLLPAAVHILAPLTFKKPKVLRR